MRMPDYGNLKGDPEEYNPSRADGGTETEGVPDPGELGDGAQGRESVVFDSTDTEWDDENGMWFECPYCGQDLCSKWFYTEGGGCNECGARVSVQVKVSRE